MGCRNRNKASRRTCILCKRRPTGDQSLHRFPKDPNLNAKWMSACKLQTLPLCDSRICSLHFPKESFLERGLGIRKVLKRDAVPCIFKKKRTKQITNYSNTENKELSVETNIVVQPTPCVDIFAYQSMADVKVEPEDFNVNLIKVEPEDFNADSNFLTQPSSSTVDTVYIEQQPIMPMEFTDQCLNLNTEPEDFNADSHFSTQPSSSTVHTVYIEQQPTMPMEFTDRCLNLNTDSDDSIFESPTPSKKKRKCYPGDFTPADFASPKKAEKNLNTLLSCIQGKNKKIRVLEQKIRRLTKKATHIRGMLELLKDKCLISEEVYNTLAVC